ncbi:hypothetical protein F7018_03000 [Tenacibaculum aiptasiae]|uniref:DUF2946 domain-containing protein n=1 Tax=Tenacibaculum aiptasiae TaxID=426481 RepID=A0A7J5AQI5_9FLAO|nr:hypothetical protein [Tenacibaculum aiptasiae]KAB1159293.1 hypothetical protein F7018_03000 [Tenacibaculum aiptasiae]
MKNISIIMLILILFVPSVQAHTDAIIFDEDVTENHIGAMDSAHHDSHHENDTEEERNREHHHHCILLGISNAIITKEFNYLFVKPLQAKKKILFSKHLKASNYLDELFQPPRV